MPLQSREFEVRLLKPDGTTSIVMKVSAGSPTEAKAQVRKMLEDEFLSATLWFDGALVDTVYGKPGPPE